MTYITINIGLIFALITFAEYRVCQEQQEKGNIYIENELSRNEEYGKNKQEKFKNLKNVMAKQSMFQRETEKEENKFFDARIFELHDKSLAEYLFTFSLKQFEDCHLTIAYQPFFTNSSTIRKLAKLPNIKQV